MDGSHEEKPKVVPIQPVRSKPPLHPRLEEIRRILGEELEPIRDEEDELSDEAVIDSEKKFRKRFGYGFDWNRLHRAAVIRLKHEKDLTDREIKLFRHAGALRRTPWGVFLSASPWIALWGAFLLSAFGLMIAALVMGVWPQLTQSPMKAVKLVVFVLVILALCWGVHLTFVKPSLIQRRTERRG